MKDRSKLIVSIIENSSEYICGNIEFSVDGVHVNITEPKHKEEGRTFYCTSIIAILSPIFNGYIVIENGILTYRVF